MAIGERMHSRLVAGLKVLFPLTALVLLSTLFLLSRTVTSDPELTFLDNASEIPQGDSITAPFYTGTTPEGHAVTVTATAARPEPDDPAGVVADKLNARFDLTDGSRIRIVADLAVVNEPSDRLELNGGVMLDSSSGYTVQTEQLKAALRSITAESSGEVIADGPAGHVTAGRFEVRETGSGDDVQLFFTNGVKLIYEPAKEPGESGP